MIDALRKSLLFKNMSDTEIAFCIAESGSEIVTYEKDSTLFYQEDEPKKLFILLDGAVCVCRDALSGKRNIVATIDTVGDLFAEVFVFLQTKRYDNYAFAVVKSVVLEMPASFFTSESSSTHRQQLVTNMLTILADKAYFLNKKIQILSAPTLRQKISRLLLQNINQSTKVSISMKREEMADFIGVARPSLSRELMAMQKENLIAIHGKTIKILNIEAIYESI